MTALLILIATFAALYLTGALIDHIDDKRRER
jgi:hypothetical protein